MLLTPCIVAGYIAAVVLLNSAGGEAAVVRVLEAGRRGPWRLGRPLEAITHQQQKGIV